MVFEILVHYKLSLKLQTGKVDEKHTKPDLGDLGFNSMALANPLALGYSLPLLKMWGLDCIDLRYISAQGSQSPLYGF